MFLLGVQPFEFQQNLRETLMASVHYPRSVEFFVNECETFFNERNNFIKALHLTEVHLNIYFVNPFNLLPAFCLEFFGTRD